MTRTQAASVSIAALLLCGCAGKGTSLNVLVDTLGADGATCTLSNGDQRWTIVTPGYFHVGRTREIFTLICTKPGFQTAEGTIEPMRFEQGPGFHDAPTPSRTLDRIWDTVLDYPAITMISMKPLAPDSKD